MSGSAAPLEAYLEGVGVLGPGLPDWPAAQRVLNQAAAWQDTPTVLPVPEVLQGAERRRVSPLVKLTLAAGLEACAAAGADAAQLPAVFSSSGGDGNNCDAICRELAGERQISPTRFHNSVHNAASGYWGIATHARAASNALCAYDGSFGAGLLEALCQLRAQACRVLLIAYDSAYPEPLRSTRPIPDAFALALVLAPEPSGSAHARLRARLTDAPAARLHDGLESLRTAIPAARSLPLLALLAAGGPGGVVLDYLEDLRLEVQVAPCR